MPANRRSRRLLRDNALSLVLVALFAACWLGQSLTGWSHHNQEQRGHGEPTLTWSAYLTSGDFMEATFENWESEFFQMAAFLILSATLVQRGSAESRKPPDEEGAGDDDDEEEKALRHPPPDAPGPVHRGGWLLKVYSASLSLALAGLFLLSFALHGVFGLVRVNEEARTHGQAVETLLGYMTSSTFWFESLQNWQSEFLSVAAVVVLSILLRQRGSPESKPVHAPHAQTGQ